jgi:short-subunit dehydrogenase
VRFESALVTGASSGIGAAFARRLATCGTRRMTLAGRDPERLHALAAELRRTGVQPAVWTGDLTVPEDVAALAAHIAAAPPDLLVNNAGAGHYGAFVDLEAAPQLATIDLNVRALVALSHAYARAAGARQRGALLLVASTAGFFPVPYESVYAATKSFVILFGEALAEELRTRGVLVRTLCPGFTATEFAPRAALPQRVIVGPTADADAVARAGIAAFDGREVTVVRGRSMQVAAALGRRLPYGAVRRLAGWWMRRGLQATGLTARRKT